jgi:hypothetical protein
MLPSGANDKGTERESGPCYLLPILPQPASANLITGTRQNHPTVGNPARTHNVAHRKHGSRCDHRAVRIATPRNTNPPAVAVSNLRRNLETLFGPLLKVSVRKFGELTPLKLLAGSQRRGLVS